MKLRHKLVIVLFVITLLLSGATYGGLEFYKQETLERNQESVDESAKLAADQVSSKIRERRDYVGYVASQPSTADFSKSNRTIRGVVDNSRFFAAQVIAANGTVVAFDGQINETVRHRTIGSDVSAEAYFTEATTQSSYVSEPEPVSSRGYYLVVISAPILTSDGFRGVLAASIFVTSDTLLSPVAALNTRTHRVKVSNEDDVLLDSAEQFEQTIVSSATIDETGWTLTVERNRAELNSQIRSLAVAQGVGLLFVLLAVVLFWMWEYRMNLQQTERLLDGFGALLDGDYDASLDMDTSEEWVQISEGFEDLATGLKIREEAIHEREQRLNVLNRILRHNLRNDMNVILGYADIISTQTDSDNVARAAGVIQTKGTDLVDLGRKARWIDEGLTGVNVELRSLDIVPLVTDALDHIAHEYPTVDVQSTLPESAMVLAIPAVDTAVENIVENAFEHNDGDDARVVVAVDVEAEDENESGQVVRLTVSDNGPGIPAHEQKVVTEGSETPLEHGSGVGLWISQWLVDISNGHISFEGNEPSGTTVTLTLERAPTSD